jgi:hypothetical protein
MKTAIIILTTILSAFCEKPLPGGFHSLKEWSITKDQMEISYVVTKGTSYCLRFCQEDSGTFTLQSRNRETLLTSETKRGCIFWKCTKTEICYFRFQNMNSNQTILGFNRDTP